MKHVDEDDLVTLAGDIVSAFVSNNSVHMSDLPQLIDIVHTSLRVIAAPKPEPAVPMQMPAVPVKKSITDDYLICLEDGKHFRSLKRHLQQSFGLSPDDYRQKWGLPRDYPMVAPGYAARRSQLAKESGLGSDRRKKTAPAEPLGALDSAPRRRGRPRTKSQGAAP